MIAELRALLAECHIKSGQLTKVLEKADWSFMLQRAEEELEKAGEATVDGMFKLADEKLKFVIQLLNMARYKMKGDYESTKIEGKDGA
jgi:hypothetical protein